MGFGCGRRLLIAVVRPGLVAVTACFRLVVCAQVPVWGSLLRPVFACGSLRLQGRVASAALTEWLLGCPGLRAVLLSGIGVIESPHSAIGAFPRVSIRWVPCILVFRRMLYGRPRPLAVDYRSTVCLACEFVPRAF